MSGAACAILRRFRGSWVSSSLILVIGTVAGQAAALLVSPLLTRLLGSSPFGLLALYTALVASVGMAVSGRYDVAAVLPREEPVAREVLGLALWVTLGVGILALAIIVVGGGTLLRLLHGEALGSWIYLVPLGLGLTGLRTTLGYWANRRGDFRIVSTVQFLQAFITAGLSVTLAFLGFRSSALVAGYLGGLAAAAAVIAYRFRGDLTLATLRWSPAKASLARRYKRFPLFSASSAILDGVNLGLPVFFLSAYFAPTTVGYYAMVMRVASAPLSLISSSVSQVNLNRLMELLRSGADARGYLLRVARALALFGAIPAVLLMAVGPWLFATVFGAEWRVAGEFLQLLMPSLVVRFVVSTLSMSIEATNNSHLGALWKVCALVTSCAVLVIFGRAADAHRLMLAICISDIVLYLYFFFLQYRAVSHPRTRDQ